MRLRTLVAVLGVAMLALAADQPVEKATLDRWMQELSNWGRWGKNDQLGTVNLITPAKRRAAAALVKEGFTVSLSSDAETVKSADNESRETRSIDEILLPLPEGKWPQHIYARAGKETLSFSKYSAVPLKDIVMDAELRLGAVPPYDFLMKSPQ